MKLVSIIPRAYDALEKVEFYKSRDDAGKNQHYRLEAVTHCNCLVYNVTGLGRIPRSFSIGTGLDNRQLLHKLMLLEQEKLSAGFLHLK